MEKLSVLAEKQKQLAELQDQLVDLQSKLKDIESNPEEYTDLESLYDELLDEIYGEACEALPLSVTGSYLIQQLDPIMYRYGFSDFCSDYDYASLDIYKDTETEIEDLEIDIEGIEQEIEDLTNEIEDNQQ